MIAVPAAASGPGDGRPPGHPKPPTNPPPNPPPKTTGVAAATAAGPAAPPWERRAGRPSNHPSASGECLTPGYGAAAPVAVTESAAGLPLRSAGASPRPPGEASHGERPRLDEVGSMKGGRRWATSDGPADARRAEVSWSPSARLGFTPPRPPEFQIGGADYRDLPNDAANRRSE